MSKKVKELLERIEKLEGTIYDIENQAKMERSKAQEKRNERYNLMGDYNKNKDKIMELNEEEKALWDNVRNLKKFKEELEKDKGQQIESSLSEAVELRNEQMKKVRQDMQKAQQELLKKKYEYLVDLEDSMKKAWSKADKELEEFNNFILEHGSAKSIGSGEYKEKSGRDYFPTGYGRKNLPLHMVSLDDYSTLFGAEKDQNHTYRLFKATGEIVLDGVEAQKRLRKVEK